MYAVTKEAIVSNPDFTMDSAVSKADAAFPVEDVVIAGQNWALQEHLEIDLATIAQSDLAVDFSIEADFATAPNADLLALVAKNGRPIVKFAASAYLDVTPHAHVVANDHGPLEDDAGADAAVEADLVHGDAPRHLLRLCPHGNQELRLCLHCLVEFILGHGPLHLCVPLLVFFFFFLPYGPLFFIRGWCRCCCWCCRSSCRGCCSCSWNCCSSCCRECCCQDLRCCFCIRCCSSCSPGCCYSCY
mmetsp:Transcript_49652/g.128123  ORF Transcript_49652/g.128123 Transcript_49652/m.128123 type:complete len:245 (+) Transcript_49652:675-1409(+)